MLIGQDTPDSGSRGFFRDAGVARTVLVVDVSEAGARVLMAEPEAVLFIQGDCENAIRLETVLFGPVLPCAAVPGLLRRWPALGAGDPTRRVAAHDLPLG